MPSITSRRVAARRSSWSRAARCRAFKPWKAPAFRERACLFDRGRRRSRPLGPAPRRGWVVARTPLIAGNWKMYKTEAEAELYIQALLPRLGAVSGVDVGICVPFTDLRAMVDSARGSRVEVYAQNMHAEPERPYTGEISAPMLSELDVHGVV